MKSLEPVRRVMVACVTTEVVKVTDPAKKLRIDRVHLLNYVKKAAPGDSEQAAREDLYESVYQENLSFFHNSGIEVVEHRDVPIFKFDECFHAVYEILYRESEKGSAVYVNISSGPPEFSAAAAISSMMVEGVSIFSIGAKASGHTVPFS